MFFPSYSHKTFASNFVHNGQVKITITFPTQTFLTHFFLLFVIVNPTQVFLFFLRKWKRNTWAELPNIITIYCTLVYWSLDNMIGCDIVVPRHWHPSCLHRYPATKINGTSCTMSQQEVHVM